jgi:hypothetical protein
MATGAEQVACNERAKIQSERSHNEQAARLVRRRTRRSPAAFPLAQSQNQPCTDTFGPGFVLSVRAGVRVTGIQKSLKRSKVTARLKPVLRRNPRDGLWTCVGGSRGRLRLASGSSPGAAGLRVKASSPGVL